MIIFKSITNPIYRYLWIKTYKNMYVCKLVRVQALTTGK